MSQVEIDWLVRPPEGTSFNAALTSACRGSATVATVANFFLFEAAKQAKRNGIDKSAVDSVQVVCTHDEIIAGIQRLNRTASKKTLIGYIVKLQSWDFLQSDGYRHTYHVFFKKIQEAMACPPQAEAPKPRGRHAHKSKEQKEMTEDCSFNRKVETTISTILTEKEENRIVILSEEIVNLQSEIVDLRGEIVNLQSEIVKLKSLQSSEEASRLALEGKVDALYNLIYNSNNSNIKSVESKRENAPTRNRRSSSKSKSSSEVQSTEEQAGPDLSSLSEEEIAVYQKLTSKHQSWFLKLNENGRQNYIAWLQKFKKPTYVPLGENTVDTFNAYTPLSLEELIDLENYAYKVDGEYLRTHGGFQIHNILNFLPKWQSYRERSQKSKTGATANGLTNGSMTHDEAQGIVQDAIEKGKKHGYDIKAQAYADNGVWLVKINWDGSPLTMKSRSEWNSEFAEIHEMEQELAKKGAK